MSFKSCEPCASYVPTASLPPPYQKITDDTNSISTSYSSSPECDDDNCNWGRYVWTKNTKYGDEHFQSECNIKISICCLPCLKCYFNKRLE